MTFRMARKFKFKLFVPNRSKTMSEAQEHAQGVLERRMNFCERLKYVYKTPAELYTTCEHCPQFLCICCQHLSNPSYRRCHYFPVVFIDGACSGNGTEGALSGIGGLFGADPEYKWSISIDDEVDPVPSRTSQRAELLAAIEGVTRLREFLLSEKWKPPPKSCQAQLVVATDSEYVCKGVTEWMPKWKVCIFSFILRHQSDILQKTGWRTNCGTIVKNKDLFCKLDEVISSLERRQVKVGFWRIDRQVWPNCMESLRDSP